MGKYKKGKKKAGRKSGGGRDANANADADADDALLDEFLAKAFASYEICDATEKLSEKMAAEDDMKENTKRKGKLDQAAVLVSLLGEEGDKCPICLEEMPVMTLLNECRERAVLPCCGKFFCLECEKVHQDRYSKLQGEIDEFRSMSRKSSRRVVAGRLNNLFEEMQAQFTCPMCRCPNFGDYSFGQMLANAKKGLVFAQHCVADSYTFGMGVAKDLSKAAQWYRIAAENGHPKAAYSYAQNLFHGTGIKPSSSEAIVWYKKSADLGHPMAQLKLGALYQKGRGVEKDLVESCRLFKLAADQGLAEAQCALGMMYIKGFQGAEKNLPLGMKLIRQAAAKGREEAVKIKNIVEKDFQSKCVVCRKTEGELCRCSKCKFYHYCSRSCQMTHWRLGHKDQCCEQE